MAVLVGKPAPDFTANAVMGDNSIRSFTLSKETQGKYVVIFFYPLDFTFVCPSELIAFDHRLTSSRSAESKSSASPSTRNSPTSPGRTRPSTTEGSVRVQYPLIADVKHEICRLRC